MKQGLGLNMIFDTLGRQIQTTRAGGSTATTEASATVAGRITAGRATARPGLHAAGLLLGLLCALPAAAQSVSQFSKMPPGQPPPPWRITGLPGSSKPVTKFEIVPLDGERVLRVTTDKSYGAAIHDLEPGLLAPGTKLRWRWRLDQPLLDTDLSRRSGDDSPLKVCAMFDLPLQAIPLIERGKLSIAGSKAGGKLPSATLCYVWDHLLPVGTELNNAFSQQIRFIIMGSGERNLKEWVSQERDLTQDFLRLFGDQTKTIPPLIAIAVGADADNTQATSAGYVGDISLSAPTTPLPAKP